VVSGMFQQTRQEMPSDIGDAELDLHAILKRMAANLEAVTSETDN